MLADTAEIVTPMSVQACSRIEPATMRRFGMRCRRTAGGRRLGRGAFAAKRPRRVSEGLPAAWVACGGRER
ncbi:hypothetical protein WS65_24805 [Burkholderia anthina]|nr:hypothetical protein WS65_24805 [Burkholderia anthina]